MKEANDAKAEAKIADAETKGLQKEIERSERDAAAAKELLKKNASTRDGPAAKLRE